MSQHFAVGLAVYVRKGAKPYGWDEDESFDDIDYDRAYAITSTYDGGPNERPSYEVGGWFWLPEDLEIRYL